MEATALGNQSKRRAQQFPPTWPYTSRQPMRSGATCSAGRAKKAWGRAGRCWEVLGCRGSYGSGLGRKRLGGIMVRRVA